MCVISDVCLCAKVKLTVKTRGYVCDLRLRWANDMDVILTAIYHIAHTEFGWDFGGVNKPPQAHTQVAGVVLGYWPLLPLKPWPLLHHSKAKSKKLTVEAINIKNNTTYKQ